MSGYGTYLCSAVHDGPADVITHLLHQPHTQQLLQMTSQHTHTVALVKSSENRLTFGKVTDRSIVSCFFLIHSVHIILQHHPVPVD